MITILTDKRLVQSAVLLSTLLLAGCLPSSCNKTESRAIAPADSLSRVFATSIGEDTLAVFQESMRAVGLTYPRTLLFDEDGFLYVSDGGSGAIWRTSASAEQLGRNAQSASKIGPAITSSTNSNISADISSNRASSSGQSARQSGTEQPGAALEKISEDVDLAAPYLAGFVDDTLIVFQAGPNRIVQMKDGITVASFQLDANDSKATLRYAGVDNDQIVIKALDEKSGGTMVWYSGNGVRLFERRLEGEYWRHSGLLKSDGDSLLSLRGYLPVIDIYVDGEKADSVGLFGFDSPMLARTRSFEYSSVKAPPLLASSTAACGDSWYLLNVRPGWVRIDRYTKAGRLTGAYTQPNPSFDRELLTTDLAVWCADGQPIIAVAVASPTPEIRWFTLPSD